MSENSLKIFRDFELSNKVFDVINNYELFLMPNKIYITKKIECDNYLYPLYYFSSNNLYYVSTSVYSLINFKKKFIRYFKINNADFFIPTYRTIDKYIYRARPRYRRTDNSINNEKLIAKIGSDLIQSYITKIENLYPDYVNLLFMGGKDSQNIILTERKNKWIVMTSSPMDKINKEFIKYNNIKIERFVSCNDNTNNEYLHDEIIAGDCLIDLSHLRWVNEVYKLHQEFKGKIVIWFGTAGDGFFTYSSNSRDIDHYAVYDLHVGQFIGTQHQIYKNLFDIPVLSPYQSPEILNKLFYKYDLYCIDKKKDLRIEIGENLFNKKVLYPKINLTPKPYERKRFNQIEVYIKYLKLNKIKIHSKLILSNIYYLYSITAVILDKYSSKRRSKLSFFLYYTRNMLSYAIPYFKNNRFDIKKKEIK